MISSNDLPSLVGTKVCDSSGDKIGTVGRVYLDDASGAPQWVTVSTGLFGTRESFLPITHAELADGVLTVPVTKDAVKDAPQIDGDGHLAAEQEAELYRHYGLDDGAPAADPPTTAPGGPAGDRSMADDDGPAGDRPMTDDTEAAAGDGTPGDSESPQTGTPRLRRYVTTETQTIQVPVTREEFRVEWDQDDEGPAQPR